MPVKKTAGWKCFCHRLADSSLLISQLQSIKIAMLHLNNDFWLNNDTVHPISHHQCPHKFLIRHDLSKICYWCFYFALNYTTQSARMALAVIWRHMFVVISLIIAYCDVTFWIHELVIYGVTLRHGFVVISWIMALFDV